MTQAITWVHIGDLHMDEEDGWQSRDRLQGIVSEINEHIGVAADFVFLPGDNANHATPEQYRAITDALAPLQLPYRVITGDHDFEPGNLDNYHAGFPEQNRSEVEVIAGYRCIFLDIISKGAGGPDFRLTMHHRKRLMEELARAEAQAQVPLVFMHAYPGDLAAEGDLIAQALADARVAFVDTGHTHYSELLNDGRVIYGATRSTGQIEEGGGKPGYSLITVYGRVPSWRFKETDTPWPFVQIVSPADLRMVTRPADPQQIPRPGKIEIIAKLFGVPDGPVMLTCDDLPGIEMTALADAALWSGVVHLDAGMHAVTVANGSDRDTIRLLVREPDNIPQRGMPVALGCDVHSIGAWPEHGLEGAQLGPNKNGMHW
ncbi:metallophosphoesterase family protein [Pseudomonas huanghezhanensis]|uniref:metallophosphoesterase family protein n=1 Tax=Pseudomonas huanghezhanensis TaxID=3002903 RepID=UPI002286498C|nr:metallophosphoesterase [Pseudomonas sp. BSw22131]